MIFSRVLLTFLLWTSLALSTPSMILDVVENALDSSCDFILRLIKCIVKFIFLSTVAMLMFLLIAPTSFLYAMHFCFSPDMIPDIKDLRTRRAIYDYVIDVAVENATNVLGPVIQKVQEIYAQHLGRKLVFDLVYEGIKSLAWQSAFMARSFSVDGAENVFIASRSIVRIIFDSGASTNLVFDPLRGDAVVGPRKLNLAAGETSTGNVTVSGEVLLPDHLKGKCTEELISMGRFALHCGKVIWQGKTCDLYSRDIHGNEKLLFKLPVVNCCPMMTEEQARLVRVMQRAALSLGTFAHADDGSVELIEFSPSLALFDETCEIFDKAHTEGEFLKHEALLYHFQPHELREQWQEANRKVVPFLCQLLILHQEQTTVLNSILETGTVANASKSTGSTSDPASVGGSPTNVRATSANPTSVEKTVRSQDTVSDNQEPDQLNESWYSRSELPLDFKFSDSLPSTCKVKVGVNPNATKSPQGKTDLNEKLRFYRSTKGAWVIWGDVHFSSHKGYDGSTACWVFHCSRLKAKNPSKPSLEEIETCELNFPIRENTGQAACTAIRHCLECLGIWTDDSKQKVNFYFESEGENSLDSKLVEEYILSCHGHHHFSVPYRHPAKEFAVKNLLSKVRAQLERSSMPPVAWPAVVRAVNEENASKIKDRVYQNRTFLKGFETSMVGRYVQAFVPGLKRGSVDSKQVPALLLHSAPRDRVWIIHATEKDLGYRCTSVQWSQVSFPTNQDWVFTSEQLENLKLLKYMKQPFQTRIVSKLKKPTKLTCPRCIRLHKRGDKQDVENDFTIKGHTCDNGCNYIAYDCFTNLEFADTARLHDTCPMAEVLHRVLVSGEKFAANLSKVDFAHEKADFRSCFSRPVHSTEKDWSTFRFLLKQFEDEELRDQTFNCPKLSAEQCATMFFLAKENILPNMQRTYEEEKERCARNNWSEEEYFAAVIVKNKDVLAQCEKHPKAMQEWLAANNKELENLIQRGVLKVVKWSELVNLDRDSYELIPSLIVYSIKEDGRKKSRLVACGNYQITSEEKDGIQSGLYAGTTSQIVWRSLINVFCQGKQSVGAMDVSEAFTQTDEESQGKRGLKTFLRLPSQWKSKILPSVLRNAGCTIGNYSDYLLQILRSIYGESSAPKRWQETLKRCLNRHGFQECQLEESLFFKVHDGKVTIISTYVDDIWVFSMCPDMLVQTMYLISRELRCTPGEILCGAPTWMWDKPAAERHVTFADQQQQQPRAAENEVTASSLNSISETGERAGSALTSEQKDIKAFFKPLKGTPRYGVATPEDPMTYVAINIYFQGEYLILDQSSYMEKAYQRMKEKKVFDENMELNMSTLRKDDFNHLLLFEDSEANPLLTKEQLSLLRIGVNTLSFYALSVGVSLQAALGQVARGQANGRKRHLDSLRRLIFYAYQHRNEVLSIHCPPWAEPCSTLDTLRIFMSGHVDASMGMSSALGTDGHARQGYHIMVGVIQGEEALVSSKSGLQSTIALSTCEAELTAASWAAKMLIGMRNLFREIFPDSFVEVPNLFGDNKAANLLASNQASLRNHRHLQLPQLWIRQQTKESQLKIFPVSTHLNTSDMLTKVLSHQDVTKLLRLLGYYDKNEPFPEPE